MYIIHPSTNKLIGFNRHNIGSVSSQSLQTCKDCRQSMQKKRNWVIEEILNVLLVNYSDFTFVKSNDNDKGAVI